MASAGGSGSPPTGGAKVPAARRGQPPDGLSSRNRSLRWAGLGLLGTDVALVAGLAGEGSVLAQPGGARYIVDVLLALGGYAVAAITLSIEMPSRLAVGRQIGVRFGLVTGAMWVVSLGVETFAGLTGLPNIAATGPLLLGGFILWGVAAARTRRRTCSVGAGVLAAVCAAMTCVALTIAFGLTLAFLALPRLERNIDGSPEYLGSGWHNLHAFAIANTLDAAFTHLLVAPMVAVVVGTLGALAAANRTSMRRH